MIALLAVGGAICAAVSYRLGYRAGHITGALAMQDLQRREPRP